MGMKVVIVGGGRVGGYLAGLLAGAGHRVRVVERDPETAQGLAVELPEGTVVVEAVGWSNGKRVTDECTWSVSAKEARK